MRPRGVRCRKPCWIRYGSSTSSMVSRSSPIAAARLSTPTGPPSNLSSTLRSSLRSIRSKPTASTSSIASAASATCAVMLPSRLHLGDNRARGAAAGWRSAACRARAWRFPARPPASNRRIQQRRRARDDARQFLGVIELQPRDDAEAVAQRIGQHARARGRTDQRERLQVQLHAARRRAFADHDVDLVILQRRIQNFLDHRREPVDFVDEQHVVGFEVGQQRGEIAGALEHRAGSLPQVHAHFARDDVRQRGLAETRRPEQQHVVERLAGASCSLDEDLQLPAHFFLADIFFELARAQRPLERFFVRRDGRGRDDALGGEIVGFDHAFIVPCAARAKLANSQEVRRQGLPWRAPPCAKLSSHAAPCNGLP